MALTLLLRQFPLHSSVANYLHGPLLARGEITERLILKTELPQAEKNWFINSVRGWLEVVL